MLSSFTFTSSSTLSRLNTSNTSSRSSKSKIPTSQVISIFFSIISKSISTKSSSSVIFFTMTQSSSSTNSSSLSESNKIPSSLPLYKKPATTFSISYTSTSSIPCTKSILNTRISSNTLTRNISFFTIKTTISKITTFNTIQISWSSILFKTTTIFLLPTLSISKLSSYISLELSSKPFYNTF